MASSYDVIVVRSGHNGLVCGAYPAKARRKTLVLERRGIVGGAAVTEEFSQGLRGSRFAEVMSLLHPRWADYRTPIAERYQCASLTHPGGGVSGIPGHNAAREILKDWKRLKRG